MRYHAVVLSTCTTLLQPGDQKVQITWWLLTYQSKGPKHLDVTELYEWVVREAFPIMQNIKILGFSSLRTNDQAVNRKFVYLAVPGFYILSETKRMCRRDKDSFCEAHVVKATVHPSSHT